MMTILMAAKIQAETTFEIGGNYQVKQLSLNFAGISEKVQAGASRS